MGVLLSSIPWIDYFILKVSIVVYFGMKWIYSFYFISVKLFINSSSFSFNAVVKTAICSLLVFTLKSMKKIEFIKCYHEILLNLTIWRLLFCVSLSCFCFFSQAKRNFCGNETEYCCYFSWEYSNSTIIWHKSTSSSTVHEYRNCFLFHSNKNFHFCFVFLSFSFLFRLDRLDAFNRI